MNSQPGASIREGQLTCDISGDCWSVVGFGGLGLSVIAEVARKI